MTGGGSVAVAPLQLLTKPTMTTTLNQAAINQLLELPKTLRIESIRLVETGNMDALGACWKSIKALRGQCGMWALVAIRHFLTNSKPKNLPKPRVVIKAINDLLDSAQILMGDESRVLIAAEVAKLATLLVMT
jgi:hypothetical protein